MSEYEKIEILVTFFLLLEELGLSKSAYKVIYSVNEVDITNVIDKFCPEPIKPILTEKDLI